MRTCIIVLCGLPASRKTTFAKWICEQTDIWENHYIIESEETLSIHHIDYDTIFTDLLSNANTDKNFDPYIWQQSREKAFDMTKSLLTQTTSNRLSIILIDDNMYYHSMRLPFYKLARKSNASFLEIYIESPLEVLLSNNRQRTGRHFVSEDIITSMYNKFEKPDSSLSWEKNSITIDSTKPFEAKEIVDAVALALKNPPSPEESIEEIERMMQEKAKSREANISSFAHQMDLSTRKIMGKVMSAAKQKNIATESMTQLASDLNKLRHEFLQNVHENKIEVPSLFSSNKQEIIDQLNLIFEGKCNHILNKQN